jgi:hypothetical protein
MRRTFTATDTPMIGAADISFTGRIVWMCIWAMIALSLPGATTPQPVPRLTIRENGRALFLISGKRSFLIKRVEEEEEIQAYKLLSDNSVFVAYSYYASGPGTTISIIDLEPRVEHVIGDLGGTQDISFAFRPATHIAVFNWKHGVYGFDIDRAQLIPENDNRLQAFEKSLTLLYECGYRCYSPQWRDSSTLSFIDQRPRGPDARRSIEVPARWPDGASK